MKNVYERFHENVLRLFVKPSDYIGRCLHASVGAAGEGGELLDAVKKTWIYNAPLDVDNIIEESGDALFYIDALLHTVGSSIEEAMQKNMDKLYLRYPEGYSDECARGRADKLEEVSTSVQKGDV